MSFKRSAEDWRQGVSGVGSAESRGAGSSASVDCVAVCGYQKGGHADESCSRSREKLYRSVNRLVRAYAEIKGEMGDAGYTTAEQADIDKLVTFYVALRETIGNASGDFIDLKSYEADMRRLIDTYIKADDSRKIRSADAQTASGGHLFLMPQAANRKKCS